MYRKLKSLDHDSFQTCIIDSLASFKNSNDLDELVESYTQSLTTALNKYNNNNNNNNNTLIYIALFLLLTNSALQVIFN